TPPIPAMVKLVPVFLARATPGGLPAPTTRTGAGRKCIAPPLTPLATVAARTQLPGVPLATHGQSTPFWSRTCSPLLWAPLVGAPAVAMRACRMRPVPDDHRSTPVPLSARTPTPSLEKPRTAIPLPSARAKTPVPSGLPNAQMASAPGVE